jgi:hypothetical protein
MTTCKQLGAVKNVAREPSPWTTLRWLEELDSEW